MYKHLTSCTNQNRIDRTKKENLEDEQNYNSSIYNISYVYVEPAFDRSQCMASMYVKHTSMRHIALIVLYCACASAISSHSFTITTALFTFPGIDYSSIYLPKNKKTATKHADIHSQKDIHPAIVNAQNDSVQIGL